MSALGWIVLSPFFAYDANYLIDNKLGIIVDAEGTRANRSEETAVTETMIARVAGRYDLSPKRLAADTAYGTGRLLRWLTDGDIAPHIPVWDKSRQTNGRYTRARRAQRLPLPWRQAADLNRQYRPGPHPLLPGSQK
jgi:DDE family transposase